MMYFIITVLCREIYGGYIDFYLGNFILKLMMLF